MRGNARPVRDVRLPAVQTTLGWEGVAGRRRNNLRSGRRRSGRRPSVGKALREGVGKASGRRREGVGKASKQPSVGKAGGREGRRNNLRSGRRREGVRREGVETTFGREGRGVGKASKQPSVGKAWEGVDVGVGKASGRRRNNLRSGRRREGVTLTALQRR